MEVYNNEEQQLEAIKRFWNEYGKTIVAGVVLGLAGLYGWRYYQAEQRTSAEQASSQYQQLLDQQQADSENWQEQAQAFISSNNSNNYALFAALLAAKEAADQKQYDVAARQLSWVIERSKDVSVTAVAQLRLARVQRELGDYASALSTLQSTVPASFVAQQAELKGDILQLNGDLAAAKSAYQQALDSSGANQQLLRIKLDELAHITAG